MPPVKQHFLARLEDGRFALVIPPEDLEPSYQIHLLSHGEVAYFSNRFGPAPAWLEYFYHHPEYRIMLPPVFRHSLKGDFGSFEIGGEMVVPWIILPPERRNGTVARRWGIVFEEQRFPDLVVEEVVTYPEKKPSTCHINIDGSAPLGSRPLPSDLISQPCMPDVVEVERIDDEGRVHTTTWGIFTWSPAASLKLDRFVFLEGLEPTKKYLVRLTSGERFVAFVFVRGKHKVVVLANPTKNNATFYGRFLDSVVDSLEGTENKERLVALGFHRLLGIGDWRRTLERVVGGERIVSDQTRLPRVLKVSEIDSKGYVHLRKGVYCWAPSAKLELERLHVLWELGPTNVYLVRCFGNEDRYVAFFFEEARMVVLTCPVTHHATFFAPSNGIKPRNLAAITCKADAGRAGFRRMLHVGHWTVRMREVVQTGQPRTWSDHGELVRRA